MIPQLPKVELHLHLDCGLSYRVVKTIDPTITREMYLQDFVAPLKCASLSYFLTRAIKGYQLMQTEKQLALVVHDLFDQLAAQHVIYAEIRFAPLQHCEKGLSPMEVVVATEAATKAAIQSSGIEARLILCTLRHYNENQSMETVQLVEKLKGTCVAGFDIAADEAGFAISEHIAAFKYAHEKDIPCTAHAGEAMGAASVWETLKYLAPSRIGHGVRSIEDAILVNHLVRHSIHLEVCPSCNVQTGLYDSLQYHPVHQLYKAGVSLSISTDAPTIVGTSLSKEYQQLQETFGWTLRDFYQCNLNAIKCAFIPQQLKERLIYQLTDGYPLEATVTG